VPPGLRHGGTFAKRSVRHYVVDPWSTCTCGAYLERYAYGSSLPLEATTPNLICVDDRPLALGRNQGLRARGHACNMVTQLAQPVCRLQSTLTNNTRLSQVFYSLLRAHNSALGGTRLRLHSGSCNQAKALHVFSILESHCGWLAAKLCIVL